VEQRKRLRRGRDLGRSLTLLRVFLLASALICAGAGVALGSMLSHSLTKEALSPEETSLDQYVDGVVHPVLVHHGRVATPRVQDGRLASRVMRQPDIVTVKVWKRSGLLVWTNPISRTSGRTTVHNLDRRFIGKRPSELDDELEEAIHESRPVAELVGTGADGEDAFERNKLGLVGRLHRLDAAVPAVLHHHERWDGEGYPHGLRGDAIPLEAAIVGLSDAVDAMTTDRPSSAARSLEDATAEVVRNRGTQFAPAVVDAFVTLVERVPELFGADPPADELIPA
jgi:HD domain